MATFFKYLIAAMVVFGAYNEFLMMHRESAFNDLGAHSDKAAVIDAIGQPKYAYTCGSNEPLPAFLMYMDSFCKEGVQEVDAFPLCHIGLRCPGWNYIGFNQNHKLVSKYRFAK